MRSRESRPAAPRDLEARLASVETLLSQYQRRSFVEAMLDSGRVALSEVASIERAFDASPEATIAIVSGRPANAAVAAANWQETETDAEPRAYADAASERLAIPAHDLI